MINKPFYTNKDGNLVTAISKNLLDQKKAFENPLLFGPLDNSYVQSYGIPWQVCENNGERFIVKELDDQVEQIIRHKVLSRTSPELARKAVNNPRARLIIASFKVFADEWEEQMQDFDKTEKEYKENIEKYDETKKKMEEKAPGITQDVKKQKAPGEDLKTFLSREIGNAMINAVQKNPKALDDPEQQTKFFKENIFPFFPKKNSYYFQNASVDPAEAWRALNNWAMHYMLDYALRVGAGEKSNEASKFEYIFNELGKADDQNKTASQIEKDIFGDPISNVLTEENISFEEDKDEEDLRKELVDIVRNMGNTIEEKLDLIKDKIQKSKLPEDEKEDLYYLFEEHIRSKGDQPELLFSPKASRIITAKIRHEGDKWILYSEKGKKLGEFNSKKDAVKRLRQVEYFKHKKANEEPDISNLDKAKQKMRSYLKDEDKETQEAESSSLKQWKQKDTEIGENIVDDIEQLKKREEGEKKFSGYMDSTSRLFNFASSRNHVKLINDITQTKEGQ